MRFAISMPRWAAIPLGLVLFACGGDGLVEPPTEPPSPAAIVMVSGNDQEGKAGELLPEPFVVRVTDANGDGVEGVEVTWRTTSGHGTLFEPTRSVVSHSSWLTTPTNAGGLAAARLIPTTPGALTVTAVADGLEGGVATFTTRAAPHDWPPVSGSALVYERTSEHGGFTDPYHGTLFERYVLHENGRFALQFDSGKRGFFEYAGTYSRDGGSITLDFDAWSAAGDWRAGAGFDDSDCLVVEYNIIMLLSDFEDGVYCPASDAR